MKKYKLKKDLPTFKAGDIFTLADNGNLYKDIGEPIPICAYTVTTLEKFPSILTDWFEEIPEEPKTVWDLQGNDHCWVIGDDCVWGGYWCTITDAVDKRNVGNITLTREEAEKELARRKAKQILLRDTKGFKPDWSSTHRWGEKCFVVYDIDRHSLRSDYTNVFLESKIYFATEEDAKASIKAHEKEWKTYLGVEE